jgi:hypothetical protein
VPGLRHLVVTGAWRRVRDLPLGGRPVLIYLAVRRFLADSADA